MAQSNLLGTHGLYPVVSLPVVSLAVPSYKQPLPRRTYSAHICIDLDYLIAPNIKIEENDLSSEEGACGVSASEPASSMGSVGSCLTPDQTLCPSCPVLLILPQCLSTLRQKEVFPITRQEMVIHEETQEG